MLQLRAALAKAARAVLAAAVALLLTVSGAGGAWAQSLEYVTGAFRFDTGVRLDTDERKQKYPFFDNGTLVILDVDDHDYYLAAFRVADILDPARWRKQPLAEYPERRVQGGGFGDEYDSDRLPLISAFLAGPSFLERYLDGGATLHRIPPGAPILKGEFVRDYRSLGQGRAARATPTGLWVGDGLFYRCKEVVSFDVHDGRLFAISYNDEDNSPHVCLLREAATEPCQCRPLSGDPEFLPSFSGDGRFLAVAVNAGGRWDLRVYSLPSTETDAGRACQNVADVAFYDIRTDDFGFRGSYGWLRNTLFFIDRHDDGSRSVRRMVCSQQTKRCGPPQELAVPGCFSFGLPAGAGDGDEPAVGRFPADSSSWREDDLVWAPAAGSCGSTPRRGQVEIREVTWLQPFAHDQTDYLAVQAVVRPQCEVFVEEVKWLSRMLVFRVAG